MSYQAAIDDYTQAIKLAPQKKVFWLKHAFDLRGQVYLLLNKVAEAREDFLAAQAAQNK
jgi:predicted negative regulator of RcsB-dependent stress response